MKKAFWLLPTFILLVGCGAFYPKAKQNSLLPAPAQLFQEFSFLPADRLEEILYAPPVGNSQAQVQGHTDSVLNSNPPSDFCYRDESLLPLMTGTEEEFQTDISILEPLPFFALPLIENEGNSNSQSFLWEPRVFLLEAEAKNGALSPSPSMPSGKARTENIEGKAHAGNGVGEELEENSIEAQPPDGSDIIADAEDGLQHSPPASETELVPPAPLFPELAAKEAPAENKSSFNFLASFPALLNEKVSGFIDFFQTRADTFFTNSLARSQAYESMMKKILREKNLPEELFYLALIESGFDPYAQSHAKACGIWQFMTKTAKRFGLKVDKWVDERRDPEKSTYAAAEYLKNLHEMFNCWFLATASYNAGEGKILQAMKKANSQDFWEISKHRYLKRETKEYVPMFLAAVIIAQDPQKYGFSHVNYHPPLLYEKVGVPPATRLDRIARAAKTDLAEIRALNPSLRRDKTPPDGPLFEIKLPPGKKEVFENNFFKVCKSDSSKLKTHKVRRGETLSQIAKKNRVSIQELCECNQISAKTLLRPGVTLLVPP